MLPKQQHVPQAQEQDRLDKPQHAAAARACVLPVLLQATVRGLSEGDGSPFHS